VVKLSKKSPFKGRQFTAEIILWAVHWYLPFPISCRDLERMLADRGVEVTTRPCSAGSGLVPPSWTSASVRISI
jgi:hypothetical protein